MLVTNFISIFLILISIFDICILKEENIIFNGLEKSFSYKQYMKKEYKKLSKEENPNNDNWDEIMSDYHEDFLYRLKLKKKKMIYFQEEINLNSVFSGVFISDNNEKLLMKVFINNKEIYSACSNFNSFRFNVDLTDNEKNVLRVLFYSESDMVFTYTMGTDKSKILTKENLSTTSEKISKIHAFTKKYYIGQLSKKLNRNELNKSKFCKF